MKNYLKWRASERSDAIENFFLSLLCCALCSLCAGVVEVENGMCSVNDVKSCKSRKIFSRIDNFRDFSCSSLRWSLLNHLTLTIYYQFNAPFINDSENFLNSSLLNLSISLQLLIAEIFFNTFSFRINLIYLRSFIWRQERTKTLIEQLNWFQLLWD